MGVHPELHCQPQPRGQPELQWQVVSRLASRAPAWDALVEGAPVPSPFLRSWWLAAVETDATCYVLVRENGALVGGVSLQHDRVVGVSRYRFAGQGALCPDHLDLIAAPGRETEVAAAFRDWFTSPGQRTLDLDGLVTDSLLAHALDRPTERRDVAPYQPLVAAEGDFLATRSASFRRSVRRQERTLSRAGLHHRRVPSEGVSAALDRMAALLAQRGGRDSLLDWFATLRTAVTLGVEQGEARVDVLAPTDDAAAHGGVVAVAVSFVVAGRLRLYQLARSGEPEHAGAGTVLLARVVSDAAEAGIVEVDLLRGDEAYKHHFAGHERPVHRLRVGHGLVGTALAASWRARTRAARRLRFRSG